LSNAAAQSAALSGGIAPVNGFHSVIDKPDSVSRVMPPITTIEKTRAATVKSQLATAFGRAFIICGYAPHTTDLQYISYVML
jgi:hypothetical protein